MNKYSLDIRWSDEDQGYIALHPEFSGLSAFGETVEEAIVELEAALKLVIETYEAEGWPPPEPRQLSEHSGKLLVRMPKSLHGRLVQRADAEGVSLNTLVVTLLSEAVGLYTGLSRVDRVITRVLQGWNTGLARTVAALAQQREVTSETTRVRFDEKPGFLNEVSATRAQVRYLQQITKASSPELSR